MNADRQPTRNILRSREIFLTNIWPLAIILIVIGHELKALRQQMGLTQAELAEKLGVPWNTVARWEVGMRKIFEPVARLVQYLAKEMQAEKKKRRS